MKKWIFASAATAIMLAGCGMQTGEEEMKIPVMSEGVTTAMESDLINAKGETIGKVLLTEGNEGTGIRITAEGLEPGVKAIHVHEKGECTPPDFESTGAHLNPEHKQHGFENPKGFHAGDLPNIEVDKEGKVDLETTSKYISLKEGNPGYLLDKDGSAVVVHEGPDDYKTDPAGNSGPRIACAAFNKK
ncbi:superoxide dismutase [Bhargavaea cecembensis]|uniref:Superoxide dismutase n=1 Tax=Bhargavaea cecembensis TaxID=394098 RepID=A0A161SIV3_9BACL|nr:superoxide dismutase family protein [Bhargavaea cecembensis]KZE37103.1 superoxide dismutase [Bhargavaea cecembensis]